VGEKTVYAWAKAGGEIGESASVTVNLVEPGTEDTENWDKTIDGGGANPIDFPFEVTTDSQENVYVVGFAAGVAGNGDNLDGWVKKFSSNGTEDTENWNKGIDWGDKIDGARAVAVDSEDNVYVAGSGDSVGGGPGHDWWIKKFSSDGTEDTTNWNIKINGRNGSDFPTAAAVDGDDALIVVGNGDDLLDPVSTDEYWWIHKYTSSGGLAWEEQFDHGGGSTDQAWGVAVDSANRVYVVGFGENLVTGSSNEDWWIKRFSSGGTEDTTHWDQSFNSPSKNDGEDRAFSVAVDSGDNVYVYGTGENLRSAISGPDLWLKKFDTNGNEEWEKKLDGNFVFDVASSVHVDGNDNVMITGIAMSGSSSYDWWTKKYDSDGAEETEYWDLRLEAAFTVEPYPRSAMAPSGNLYFVYAEENAVDATSSYDWRIRKLINDGD